MRRYSALSTANLLAAAQLAGVGHYVALSAIGADFINSGYFKAKRLQEKLIMGGSIPYTIVRSAPFFEFIYRYVDRSEEHTSELQSLMRISYAVFCLKKKKN